MSLFAGITLPGCPDLENIRRLDVLPIPAVMEMMRYGFKVDVTHLRDVSAQLGMEMDALRQDICAYIPTDRLDEFVARSNMDDDSGVPMNVESSSQLSELLFSVLKVGDGKQLKMTNGGDRPTTGKKQLEQLKHEHPVVPIVLLYREKSKLRSFADGLPEKARVHYKGECWCGRRHNEVHKRIHTTLLTTRTDTGRLASKDPNLQQIPVRSELGRLIRAAFVPERGYRLVGCDLSQIEMRLGADYSHDANLTRIFREGLDPHTDTAKRAFNTDHPDKLTQRDPCKNVNFGVFYGLAGDGLYDLMAVTYATARMPVPEWLTVKWCDQFIEQWFDLYPGVRGYLEDQHYRAYRYGYVWTKFGRIRRVPEVKSVHNRIAAQGLRQAGNTPIQGTCADIMRLIIGMMQNWIEADLRPNGVRVYPLLTVHDELILEVEEDYADTVSVGTQEIFEQSMTDESSGECLCSVPIKAESKVMERWEK